ncbi:NH(3)-dependent NAD(+) synthetase [Lepeophtheirus salmonis]|uniref:NH(3)-dependent NAD(+) synthetase n=1 Tax=Lepeophtheirus salmonis TaxID=72036 RepID=UPI001AE15398|nr:NH(3)-dependent NAD(+) synthetase-like [Lepeophtheirus salmonis]
MQAQKVIDHIVQWLQKYAHESRVNGFVVGISGGIDSAVTSTLCSLTGMKVICLNLPIHQVPAQVSQSDNHIAWLKEKYGEKIDSHVVNLTPTFDTACKDLPLDIQDQLTMANLRSRLRMSTLYAFAGHHRCLVAGTGNKVEDFGVGFFTKYGDGGVDLSPIADLMKSQVYSIASHLNINEEIQKAPPTDGLFGDDLTDEQQIGASYPELEWAMTFSGDELGLSERQVKVLGIYRERNRINRHKVEPIPVCKIPGEFM